MTFVKIAWRNLFKRPVHTVILLLGIATGIFTLLFFFAFINGFFEVMINAVIDRETGHIQIHHKDYLLKKDVKLVIKDPDAVIRILKKTAGIKGYSPRVLAQGLVSSPESSNFASIHGIEPGLENTVTTIQDNIVEGEMLSNDDKKGVFIGKALAEKLKIGLGDKLVLQVRDINGDMSGGAYRVKGLYKTGSKDFDKTQVFITIQTARGLLGLDKEIHEIAIRVEPEISKMESPMLSGKSKDKLDVLAEKLSREVETLNLTNNKTVESSEEKTVDKSEGEGGDAAEDDGWADEDGAGENEESAVIGGPLEVKTWKQINPVLWQQIEMSGTSIWIMFMFVFVAMAFGIVNTFLMEIFERVKEFGIMMALGTSPLGVFITIVYESLFLGVVGSLIGTFFSWLLIYPIFRNQVDLSIFTGAMDFIDVSSIVPMKLVSIEIFVCIVVTIVIVVVSSLYPAFRASRFKPVEAIRYM